MAGRLKKMGRAIKDGWGWLSRKAQSVDGFDEIAQGTSTLMSGIAVPIAKTCITGPGILVTGAGAVGQVKEYTKVYKEYAENAGNIQELQTERNAIKGKIDEGNTGLADKYLNVIVEHEALKKRQIVAKHGRNFGWTGVVGMMGMTAGLIAATVKSFAEILVSAKHIANTAMLTKVLSGFSLASTVTFGIGQGATIFYAANEKRKGQNKDKVLCENLELLSTQIHNKSLIEKDTYKSLKGVQEKRRLFVRKTDIEYGNWTMSGQTMMLSSTILNTIPIVGNIPGMVLAGLGIFLTLGGVIKRTKWTGKQEKYNGEGSEDYTFTQKWLKRTELALSAEDSASKCSNLQNEFRDCSNLLAHLKLFSLIRGLIDHSWTDKFSSKYKNGKFAYLEKILETGKVSTGLNADVIEKVKEIFNQNKNTIKNMVSNLHPEEAHKILLANILKYTAEPNDNSPLIADASDRDISAKKLKRLCESLDITERPDTVRECNKLILSREKSGLKHVRCNIADGFNHVAHMEAIKEQSCEALKKSLTRNRQLTTEQLVDQHEKVKDVRRKHKHFTPADQFTGSEYTVKIWDDADPDKKGNADYQMAYIINNQTGKRIELWGKKASGQMIANGDSQHNRFGVMLREITDGKDQVLGDVRNPKIDLVRSRVSDNIRRDIKVLLQELTQEKKVRFNLQNNGLRGGDVETYHQGKATKDRGWSSVQPSRRNWQYERQAGQQALVR
jgi:hypothetical protein